jgi:osmotically-inducible protein OsmY
MVCGCSQQTINSANHDAQTDAKAVQRDAQRAEKTIDPEAKSLDWGARVSAAINLNANLPKTIRVDASPNGVRLKGSVRTKSQKTLAARVAKDTLPPDKSVENGLTVDAD